jgi:hypothetical protein
VISVLAKAELSGDQFPERFFVREKHGGIKLKNRKTERQNLGLHELKENAPSFGGSCTHPLTEAIN